MVSSTSRIAAVEGIDDDGVFLGDKAAPDFAGAGDLVVVGVEFLVEQQETAKTRRRRQGCIDLGDFVGDQAPHLGLGTEILERGIGEIVAAPPNFRPLSDRLR